MWDVVVIGAGPAGSRVAELLAPQGVTVLLLDPRAPWEKPCGGGLTGAALANTPELHELTGQAETIHEVLAIAPSGASVVLPLRRPYLVVSRIALSAWGLERARAAGASFRSVSVASVARTATGWSAVDSEGEPHHARFLVGADGAVSRVRRVVAPDFAPELAPTRVLYPVRGSPPGRAVFQFLPQAKGYVWDFPRPGHHSVGIGVAPGTFGRTVLDGALTQYQAAEMGETPGPDGHRGAVIATSAWVRGGFRDLGGRDYALLGDAGGLADPATGEGIDYALRSATLAAEAFSPAQGFTGYPAKAQRAFAPEMRRAKLIRRWLYHPAVAERLIRGARRSPRGALLLMALTDSVNEHGSISSALWRTVRGHRGELGAARAVCECPDGVGAYGPA